MLVVCICGGFNSGFCSAPPCIRQSCIKRCIRFVLVITFYYFVNTLFFFHLIGQIWYGLKISVDHIKNHSIVWQIKREGRTVARMGCNLYWNYFISSLKGFGFQLRWTRWPLTWKKKELKWLGLLLLVLPNSKQKFSFSHHVVSVSNVLASLLHCPFLCYSSSSLKWLLLLGNLWKVVRWWPQIDDHFLHSPWMMMMMMIRWLKLLMLPISPSSLRSRLGSLAAAWPPWMDVESKNQWRTHLLQVYPKASCWCCGRVLSCLEPWSLQLN